MKQWLSRMKLAHKMVLGFLGLIALPFTLLSVFSFASVASHYEHQLAQDGQYMLNMVVSDVNEKMDHVEMLMPRCCPQSKSDCFSVSRLQWRRLSRGVHANCDAVAAGSEQRGVTASGTRLFTDEKHYHPGGLQRSVPL